MSSRVIRAIYAGVIVAVCLIVWLAWHSATKVVTKQYSLTGQVVAVHADANTVTVHNDNIPGLMAPMNMDYQLQEKDMVSKLKTGDPIHATLVTDAQNIWRLDNLQVVKK